MSGKRIMIVFEEGPPQDGGVGFNVTLEGLSDGRRAMINSMTPEEQLRELSTAEFWALRCFQIVGAILMESGAMKTVHRRRS